MITYTVTSPDSQLTGLALKAAVFEACRQLNRHGSTMTTYNKAKRYNGEYAETEFRTLDGQTVTVAKVY